MVLEACLHPIGWPRPHALCSSSDPHGGMTPGWTNRRWNLRTRPLPTRTRGYNQRSTSPLPPPPPQRELLTSRGCDLANHRRGLAPTTNLLSATLSLTSHAQCAVCVTKISRSTALPHVFRALLSCTHRLAPNLLGCPTRRCQPLTVTPPLPSSPLTGLWACLVSDSIGPLFPLQERDAPG